MDRKAILFTAPGVAELQELPAFTVQHPQDVLVRMEYTVVSGGTERANLMGLPNTPEAYPKALGYCGVGRVLEIGDQVTKVAVGDRVLVYHGVHSTLNCRRENEITKVYQEDMDSLDASLVIIASMGLGGVRKLELELGESAMVMGLGLLGMSAVQFCRLSGAYPLIAVDLNPTRRQLALELGADYALDPADPDFVRQVKEITGGKGVNACVEVTGVSAAMHQALECAATQGRISLLGCTRISDCSVDYYQLVHKPGVKLIGAHNFIRPKVESYPHHWTHEDDCQAILRFIASGRFRVKPMISRVVAPEQCPDIFHQLATDPNFPLGTVFDWRNCK